MFKALSELVGGRSKAPSKISLFATVVDTPGEEKITPNNLVLVRWKVGPMVAAQLTDLDGTEPEIGMPVEIVTRRIRQDGDEQGMVVYGNNLLPVMAGKQ